MADKIECYIVRDLLPLYNDHLVSPETEAALKEHLKSCSECSELYGQIAVSELEPGPDENGGELDYLKKLRRKWIAVILGAAAVLALSAVLLFRSRSSPVGPRVSYDADSRTVAVAGTTDYGSLALTEEMNDAVNLDVQDESFHMSVYLPILKETTGEEDLSLILPDYLDSADRSLDFIRGYIRDNAPELYSKEEAGKYVEIIVSRNGLGSFSNEPDRIRVDLSHYYWHLEELYLFALMNTDTVEWPQFGYAWYLSACLDPYCTASVPGQYEMTEDVPAYAAFVRLKGDELVTCPGDIRLYFDAVSYVCLTEGMRFGTPYESHPLSTTRFFTGGSSDDPGNSMSVFMAASFIGYLSDNYGFDRVSSFCFGRVGFEEAFGTDFDSAYGEWSAWIVERCGE